MINPPTVLVALFVFFALRMHIVIRQKMRLIDKMIERLNMVRAADWPPEKKAAFLQKDGALFSELQPDFFKACLQAIQFWRSSESFYSEEFTKRIIREEE